jgi:hypothetical protein
VSDTWAILLVCLLYFNSLQQVHQDDVGAMLRAVNALADELVCLYNIILTNRPAKPLPTRSLLPSSDVLCHAVSCCAAPCCAPNPQITGCTEAVVP